MCVEVDARFSVKGASAASSNAFLVTSEREHRKRNRDRNVDADLAGLHAFTVCFSCSSRSGKDCGPITVFVLVDKIDSIIDCVHVKADQDWTKDLFLVTGHIGSDVGNDGRANQITVGVLLVTGFIAATIEKNGCALLFGTGYELLDTLLTVGGDHGSKLGAFSETTANLEFLSLLQSVDLFEMAHKSVLPHLLKNLGNPTLCLRAYRDERGESHTALTRGAECSTYHTVDKVVLVGIWKHSSVILRNKIGLHTLAVRRPAFEYIFACLVSSYKTNGFDSRLIDNEIDGTVRALNNIYYTFREASLLYELG